MAEKKEKNSPLRTSWEHARNLQKMERWDLECCCAVSFLIVSPLHKEVLPGHINISLNFHPSELILLVRCLCVILQVFVLEVTSGRTAETVL